MRISDWSSDVCSSDLSAWGLREGLLYQQLDPDVQALDPLIEAARAEGDREGRFQGQGEELHQWIAPLFTDEPPELARLRHAACLLADVAWRAHPDFRPDRGLDRKSTRLNSSH